MRKFSRLAATAMAVAALSATAAAQGQGHGSGKAPTTKAPTTKAPNAGTSAPKGGSTSTHSASSTKAGGSGQGATIKTSGTSQGSSHGSSKKPTTATASTGTSSGSSTSSGSGSSTTTASNGTTTTPTTFEPNAISTKISKNPNQLARVKTMLPAGMTIEEASAGFRNHGQFIAALNVSRNQNVDFVQLKDAMTVDGLSLGQAAKQIRTVPALEPVPAPNTTGSGSTTVEGRVTSGTTTALAAK